MHCCHDCLAACVTVANGTLRKIFPLPQARNQASKIMPALAVVPVYPEAVRFDIKQCGDQITYSLG